MYELISIVVPIYNIENYINHCIESLLSQTYTNYEIILIDDGSSDKSGDICDNYAKKNNCIRVIHQRNCGLSGARNVGIEEAKGDLLMFVDGDDIIDKRMLEILHKDYHSKENVLFSACWNQRIKNYSLNRTDDKGMRTYLAEDIMKNLLKGEYENISAWGKLYNKRKIGPTRFPEGKIHFEDKAFLFNILLQNPSMSITEREDELYGYFVRDNSITRSKYNKNILDVLYHSENILAAVKKFRPQYYQYAERNDVISHLIVLKSIVRSKVYHREKKTFTNVKNSLLCKYGHLSKKLLGKYKSEIMMLKIGDFLYIICVYIYEMVNTIIIKNN